MNYCSAVVRLDNQHSEHRKFHQPNSTHAILPSAAQLHISNRLEFLGNLDLYMLQIQRNQETVSGHPSSRWNTTSPPETTT